MSEATVYGLPKCDTTKKARNWLARHGVAHAFIDYREQRIAPETLKSWARELGWDALINRGSRTWRELPATRRAPGSEAEWIVLIREHPALVKRPILVMPDGRVTLGFSDALYKRIFAP